MKKLLIFFLIIVVLGVVAGFAYLELVVPEIAFVSDVEKKYDEDEEHLNEYKINRLYSSNVDFEGLAKSLEESLVSVEFTEEDILRAALQSGTPEFFPAFYIKSELSDELDGFYLTGHVQQEIASGQVDTRFQIQNLRAEMITTGGLTIEKTTNLVDDKDVNYKAAVISETQTQMTLECGTIAKYKVKFNGTEGQVILQYTFDVYSATLLTHEALSRQLLQIYADVTTDETGNLVVTYSHTDYSTIDELAEAMLPEEDTAENEAE